MVGSEFPSFRPFPPLARHQGSLVRDPSMPPPPPSNFPPAGGPFQRFPVQHFSSNAQAPPLHATPLGQPAIQPTSVQTQSFPPSLQPQPRPWPQPQTPFVSMGSPPPSLSGSNAPPPVFQPSFPGYAQKQDGAEMQAAPMHSSHPSNQNNYGPVPPATSSLFQPHQGGYVPQPPMAASLGIQPMHHLGSGG